MADIAAIERELAEKGEELRGLLKSAGGEPTHEPRREIAFGIRAAALILGFVLGFAAIAYFHTEYPVEVKGPPHICP